jgi:hypothetical protein
MKTRNYILTVIVLASFPFLSQLSIAESEGDSEWPRPEMTHPELYKLHLIKKTFKCGDAELITESSCFFSTNSPDLQCREQTIKLVNSPKGISKNLPLDGKPVKKNFKESPGPVLNTVVTDIGCVKSNSGKHFITLCYLCNWGPDCYGRNSNRESQRYFTAEGTNLTVGKPADLLYNKIFKKYGIPPTGGSYIDITSNSDN